jgi:hypothetical protein
MVRTFVLIAFVAFGMLSGFGQTGRAGSMSPGKHLRNE